MAKLGVNIDHVATLRQARREFDPDPIKAAKIAVKCGADSIVCHLREDRRHIQDKDVQLIRKAVKIPLNLEMAIDPHIIRIALRIKPNYVMFVPERREEVTTEGGLDVITQFARIKKAAAKLSAKGIIVSIFVDPKMNQVTKAKEAGAKIVELHTGAYAMAKTPKAKTTQLNKIIKAAAHARSLGLVVHAGHGLKYDNVKPVAKIKDIDELNIGHSIISEAIFSGLDNAIRRMKKLVK